MLRPETGPGRDSRRAPINREAYARARLKCRLKPTPWISKISYTTFLKVYLQFQRNTNKFSKPLTR
jgi:hypothetical protein